MERSGPTNIALRAAASGLIDYTRCDLHDHTWKYYYSSRTTALRLQDRYDRLQAKYAYYLSLVDSRRFDVDKIKKLVSEAFDDLQGWQNPVLGFSAAERKQNEEEDFKSKWQALTGFSPDDKEGMAAWESQLQEHLEKTKLERERTQRTAEQQQQTMYEIAEQIRNKRLKASRWKPTH